MEPLYVIKIGGNVIDHKEELERFLIDFARMKEKKILVHGGGKIATAIGDKLGIVSNYVNGRRITDAETLSLVTMVYGGLVNKHIVASLQSLQCNAIGVTGADANLIPAVKRPAREIDYGFAGDVQSNHIPQNVWQLLLQNGLVPVVAPLTHDGKGSLLNTNADTIAQEIGKALTRSFEVTIIYIFEKSGVLKDVNDAHSVIPKLTPETYDTLLRSGSIFSGMIPKLDNAFLALQNGVEKVVIGNSGNLNELVTGKKGTTLAIN
jgi:acetylglutamate kinase